MRLKNPILTGCTLAWLAASLVLHAPLARADNTAAAGSDGKLFIPQLLGLQFTLIRQHLYPLHSPYASNLSLVPNGDTESTYTTGVYLGVPLWQNLQGYFDLERFQGQGISSTTGLASLTDGDSIRAGTFGLGKDPYIARAFLRYVVPLSGGTHTAERGMDSLPAAEPDRYVEIKAGVMAANDDFDRNRYAGATRTQFENWSLWANTAWDFAADTRGYTDGAVVAWVNPRWELRLGVYRMPVHANGQELDASLTRSRGQNLELTLKPLGNDGTIVRLLAYDNVARMGIYANALAAAHGGTPDIVADDQPGRHKYGFGLNVEQPLADQGETGLFLRLGWDDGKTETFAFTEADRHLSLGGQLSGAHWWRPNDRLGIGYALTGLSGWHRAYLAAGGQGFVLGDGRLNYSPEQAVEVYYRIQVLPFLQVSPDFQYLWNPGDNRDRGPARVVGFRIHAEY